MREFAAEGCTINAQADGVGVADELVAGVVAGSMAVRGVGRVFAAGVCSEAGLRACGLYLLDGEPGDIASYGKLDVNASWLDATGADGGVACLGGSLASARFVTPTGGAFGASGVVDAAGAAAAHVMIEPQGTTTPAGETDSRDDSGDADKPATGSDPAAGQTGAGSSTDPVLKPAAATPKTTTTIKTSVTKTTVSTPSKPKKSTASTALPKTADNHWFAVSMTLFLLA